MAQFEFQCEQCGAVEEHACRKPPGINAKYRRPCGECGGALRRIFSVPVVGVVGSYFPFCDPILDNRANNGKGVLIRNKEEWEREAKKRGVVATGAL